MADEKKSVVVFLGSKSESIMPTAAAEVDGKVYLRDVPEEISEEEAQALRERVKDSDIRFSFREMSAERVEARRAEAGLENEEPIQAAPSSAEEISNPNGSARARGRS